jgi:hypothetical protein
LGSNGGGRDDRERGDEGLLGLGVAVSTARWGLLALPVARLDDPLAMRPFVLANRFVRPDSPLVVPPVALVGSDDSSSGNASSIGDSCSSARTANDDLSGVDVVVVGDVRNEDSRLLNDSNVLPLARNDDMFMLSLDVTSGGGSDWLLRSLLLSAMS